jgi:peptidoglycan/xylan/chitin deacetylase (PgdA/CDA1 family)
MYHHVNSLTGKQATSLSLTVKTEIFEEQMNFLTQKGYQPINPKQLYDGLNGNSLPDKSILITFDDGYVDNFNDAFPILKTHNFKFTIFLPTGLMNSGPDYLTWAQLKEMGSSGLLTAGAHTWSHKALVNLSPEKLKTEVSLSKKQIEDFYGGPVEAFAYPYGSDNKAVEEELRNESFLMAFLTTRGLQCAKLPFEFHRIRIGNASLVSYGI